ncbi:anti-phage dCTP deaminase [Chenggangzhangella methanolivorans]|uniref:CMP/dCMP-type deaminase domain-containing protein n=1 Tax=Chenggangzhangella methanolivorans TaxID=1437009 RepID=A0A9E6UNZ9_9HYPH|nr:anti-phage dCTP deaminase [Chenggangzhangella methanolivorans]QZO00844.1 hypothetical protein K6K41_04070 [Chenggangzhangella methanolivorans]
MSSTAAADLLSLPTKATVANTISDRRSQELIIALVGPVGSGVSTAAEFIREIMEVEFKYSVCPIIKPSDIIKSEAHRVGMTSLPAANAANYIDVMQTAGNKLREKFGNNYLAEKAVERIAKFRKEKGGVAEGGVLKPGRRAYIIDSIKHVDEIDLFKKVYGEMVCIFGVFAPDQLRSSRLKDGGVPELSVSNIMNRDRGEVATFGQKTRKIFVQSDFFLCNDKKKDELRQNISRYLHILFGVGVHTPTRAESAMYEASSAAANSACMSRQVGASIVAENGELIAVGWNDVPKFGGGLYNEDDQSVWDAEKGSLVDKDNRCFKWKGCVCHNETRRLGILEEITDSVVKSGMLKRGISRADVREIFKGTAVDSLIEYSRAIHAEMEAILTVAREGKRSIYKATLYTNTYPCHNCARHIVAAGIKSVIYIEPYDKSLAVSLHDDAISEDPEDRTRVVFRQYDGVAPSNYVKLFKSGAERKRSGKVIRTNPATSVPLFSMPLDSMADYEAKVIADLSDKEQAPLA